MDDQICNYQKIPLELREKFENETLFQTQIENDREVYQDYGEVYIQTIDTLKYNNWDGPLLAQKFAETDSSTVDRLESQFFSHKYMLVDKNISTNKFIFMLQRQFMPDVELKDIWFYKIKQE